MTGKKNLLLTGLISLFLLFLNTIICTFSIKYIGDNAGLIFGDKYRAVIVGFEEKDGSTSITNSRSAGRKTFYTPIAEYKDKEGNIRRKSVNTGTDRPSGTGMIITVSDSLDDDVMNDISAAKSPVVLLIFCFFSVLFSISFSVTCYGLGATNNKNIRITKKPFFICHKFYHRNKYIGSAEKVVIFYKSMLFFYPRCNEI